jgi:hypothetical protein
MIKHHHSLFAEEAARVAPSIKDYYAWDTPADLIAIRRGLNLMRATDDELVYGRYLSYDDEAQVDAICAEEDRRYALEH